MSIKKIISAFLTICICSTVLSIDSFASCFMSINGEVPYAGKAVDVNSWLEVNIPKFNGTPLASPDRTLFYSSKGEFKLKINDQNRAYFENGGSVFIRITPPQYAFRLNPLDWKNFLSYKPADNKNKLNIVVSRKTLLPYDIKLMLQKVQSIPVVIRQFIVPVLIFIFSGRHMPSSVVDILKLFPFLPITLIYYAIEYAPKFFAPIFNLMENVNPSDEISFKYGVVLTSADDEIGLDNTPLPKIGDLNKKAAEDLKRKKEADVALRNMINNNGTRANYNVRAKEYDAVKYNEYDIKELEKARDSKKPGALNKLKTTVPIREGIVCKLDAKHPTQTFRYVMNNTLDPNTTGLFSIMLANPNRNGNDIDNSPVVFDAYYSYDIGTVKNSISEGMINDPSLSEKVKFLTDTGSSDRWFTDFNNSITKWVTFARQQQAPTAQQGWLSWIWDKLCSVCSWLWYKLPWTTQPVQTAPAQQNQPQQQVAQQNQPPQPPTQPVQTAPQPTAPAPQPVTNP